jgi:multidrug efflux pump subunit AcrA (membrane-fusion protein)
MSNSPEVASDQNKKLSRGSIVRLVLFLLVVAILIGLVVARGIYARVDASADVQKETVQLAIPAVAVVHPKVGEAANEIVLTGSLRAFTEAPIYARASGYIKTWSANLGDTVKSGQLLAEIDAPEMDLQFSQAEATLQQTRAALDQAQANVQQSKANEGLAKLTADRYQQLEKDGIVAPQDNDQRQAQYQALISNTAALEQAVKVARATIASQEASLATLNQLRSYREVRAPFDGVVTARNTDLGALVNAGNPGTAPELFHVASVEKLRLFASVPEVYAGVAVAGLTADMTLEEFPGRNFRARLVRTSGAIDPTTRSLLSEFEIDNSSRELRPGSYAEVHLSLKSPARALLVPVSAVMYRPEGPRIGVVEGGGQARLAEVALGKDYGNVVEVLSGLSEKDDVIESPPDSLNTGMAVRVVGGTVRR